MILTMNSSSDSEDCQLYTRTAENIKRKRKELKAELEVLNNAIHLIPDGKINDVLEEIDLDKYHIKKCKPNDIEIIDSDSDEDLPLSVLLSKRKQVKKRQSRCKSIQSSGKSKPKQTAGVSGNRKRKTQDKCPVSDPKNIIVLDDDTGYSTTPMPPIDFKRRPKRNKTVDTSIVDISLQSISSIDYDEDDNFDNDDIVSITVEWNNGKKITRKEFKLRKYQKLETIFEELGKMEDVPASRILLMRDYNFVKPIDTPSSLDFKFYGALTGSVSNSEVLHNQSNSGLLNQDINNAKGLISVKLQLESKKSLIFKIMKNHKVSELLKMCAEELKCGENKIKITFDGECLEPNEVISDLDVEDGDIFNVYIKS
ncbi:hypothetical protein J6590_001779 [Homalodisca vitripennis]|nr:hypothetical protein J6590_001779 [Homalodisca vitripennis]